MKNIVIIPNSKKDSGLRVTSKLCDKLLSLGATVYIEEAYAGFAENANTYKEFPENAELIVVVGGDGSLLDASVIAIEKDIPLVGVNLGKVGYLSEVETDELDFFARIFTGEYTIEERLLLSVSYTAEGKTVSSERLAVNDVIISHDTFLGIADFTLETEKRHKVKYRADGMIISTPQGSTAYNLSAGGPIVGHDIEAIVATPICPHSFFNRSIIFNSSEVLKIKNIGEPELKLSLDGRALADISNGGECIIKIADKKLKILTFSKSNMFQTLFRKMRLFEEI